MSYTHDAANRLTNVGGVIYTWDDNGNLLSDGMRSYSYDHANRLTQITGTLITQYAYNGDRARISKTMDGVTTNYVFDLAAALPAVISDMELIYLYGLDIIETRRKAAQTALSSHMTGATGVISRCGVIPPCGEDISRPISIASSKREANSALG